MKSKRLILRWPPLVGFVEGWEGRERATDSFDSSKSPPFFSDFSNHISFLLIWVWGWEGMRTDDKWLWQLHFFLGYLLGYLDSFACSFIITLKERLCSEIGYAQPQDGNFVQFWDNVRFEWQDRSQVVQLPIETLPSRARYGYDRFGWKRKEKFLKFCCNQSNTSQLYNYSLTNRCWRINIKVRRPPSSNSLRNQNGKRKKGEVALFQKTSNL